jgi:hypothetical protein
MVFWEEKQRALSRYRSPRRHLRKIAHLRIPLYACTALALSAFVTPKPDPAPSQATTPAVAPHLHLHAMPPSWQLLFGTASW